MIRAGHPAFLPPETMSPALFDYLLRRDRKLLFCRGRGRQSSRFRSGVEDVEMATPTPETRRLDLVIEHGLRVEANQASTGVRLLFVFVAACVVIHRRRGTILCSKSQKPASIQSALGRGHAAIAVKSPRANMATIRLRSFSPPTRRICWIWWTRKRIRYSSSAATKKTAAEPPNLPTRNVSNCSSTNSCSAKFGTTKARGGW